MSLDLNSSTNWEADLYSIPMAEKSAKYLPLMQDLHQWHYNRCTGYKAVSDFQSDSINNKNAAPADTLEKIPFLSVRLFKELELLSVERTEVIKVLQSSGTSGQVPSRIFLDRDTAQAQTRILVKVVQNFIGKDRMPMVIVDREDLFQSAESLTARAAGVIGFSSFGADRFFCLSSDLKLKVDQLIEFFKKHNGKKILFFGFTYIVWDSLIKTLIERNLSFQLEGFLIHGGGWKKLIDQSVSNAEFKSKLKAVLGNIEVINYYGMVEQVGSIYMECQQGRLHVPFSSHVIVRSLKAKAIAPAGTVGVLQVMSLLPKSYPGHSLLTEDLGKLHLDECPCGRKGQTVEILGRIPSVEIRGCSDTT